jgi:hypothetical protein
MYWVESSQGGPFETHRYCALHALVTLNGARKRRGACLVDGLQPETSKISSAPQVQGIFEGGGAMEDDS